MSPIYDVVCLSHLRWDFVYQRPQHLLSRCSRDHRVFFIEEPKFEGDQPRLDVRRLEDRPLYVVVPYLPEQALEASPAVWDALQRQLIDQLFAEYTIQHFVLWYYAPVAVGFTGHLQPLATVYDCMDELSAFRNAPARLAGSERELFTQADLVFAGGQSLYEAKRRQHPRVYRFPSSVDLAHYRQARSPMLEPPEQASIPSPRLGFFGVLDERIDLGLLDEIAQVRPEWQFVLIGPVAKIDPDDLPRHANLHYLGMQSYDALPGYLAGWDVALMPFARNEATRFISPTKTLEYLAAGKPVISTPIHDVVHPYGELGLVRIAETPEEFVSAAEAALAEPAEGRLPEIDRFLAQTSWDRTWEEMARLVDQTVARRSGLPSTGVDAATHLTYGVTSHAGN